MKMKPLTMCQDGDEEHLSSFEVKNFLVGASQTWWDQWMKLKPMVG